MNAERNEAHATGRWWAAITWGLIGVGLIFRLGVTTRPLEWLVAVCLADDAFYYLRIAENVLAGQGLAFDGQTATNGFHPLWMLVSLATALLGGGALGGARLLLVLLSLIGAGNAWLCSRIANRLAGPVAGVWAAGFWALSPYVLFTELMGVEAPLMMLLALAAFDRYLTLREAAPATRRAWTIFGALLGLTLLARTDAILFAAPLALDAAWRLRFGSANRREEMTNRLSAIGAALAVVSPWIFFNLWRFGTVAQDSARALLQAKGLILAAGPATAWAEFHAQASKGLIDFFLRLVALPNPALALALIALLAGAVAAARLATGRSFRAERNRAAWVLPAWGFLTWAFYLFYFYHQKLWYFLPVYLAIAFTGALAIGYLDSVLTRRRAAGVAFAVLCILMAAGFIRVTADLWRGGFYPWQRNYLEAAPELRRLTGEHPGSLVGAFNSGLLSAASGLPVVNLDGVVNPEAIRAVGRGELISYLRGRNIRWLADHQKVLAFYAAASKEDWKESFTLVSRRPGAMATGEFLILELKTAVPGD